ncbi:LysR family transcriptional regulator [Rhodobacteraceae bacterium CYK-10]|uniref:LysR family transcriptional regulator n=2 Tax=Stagnihabitans tardus TaxID=2699202 RepID=A0AAE4YC59_9RHOB|nr:LysR family transcriptional regulator [Stagnihabitans tardus]
MDTVEGIKVFVAAVQTGSFSGAAGRLGISAKLASKYMAELEARLGAQLLHRTTRRLGLTAAGERLMARAPDWLDQLDEMTGDLRETGRGLTGVLRVASSVAFGELHVMPLLQRFRGPHPALQVDLRLSDRFVDLAAEGIDLALRIGRLDNSALIARKLGEVRLLLVAAPGYLDAKGMPGRLDDLSAHACIRDTNLRDGAWNLAEAGVLRRIEARGPYAVNSPRAARDLAVLGEGIALCPDYMVRSDLAEGRLVQVLCETAGPSLDIHAVHLGQRRLARRTRALLDFLARDRFDGYLG